MCGWERGTTCTLLINQQPAWQLASHQTEKRETKYLLSPIFPGSKLLRRKIFRRGGGKKHVHFYTRLLWCLHTLQKPEFELERQFSGFWPRGFEGWKQTPRLFIFILVGTFSSFTKIKNKEREREREGGARWNGRFQKYWGNFPFFGKVSFLSWKLSEGGGGRGQGNADDVTHIEDRPATHNKIE